MNVINYVAVDLELHSPKSLDSICAAFSNTEVTHLSNGKCERGYFANFEADDRGENPESLITRICDFIEQFDQITKRDWNDCYSRMFDIGFQTTNGDIGCSEALSFDALKKLVDLRCSINLTFYGKDHYS